MKTCLSDCLDYIHHKDNPYKKKESSEIFSLEYKKTFKELPIGTIFTNLLGDRFVKINQKQSELLGVNYRYKVPSEYIVIGKIISYPPKI